MAITFNPFTSNFDLTDDASGSATCVGGIASFLNTDFALNGTNYEVDIIHMLQTLQPVVTIYEGTNQVLTDIIVIDANTIQIKVSANPNGRFNGLATIIKP